MAQIGTWSCPVSILLGCAWPVQRQLRDKVRQLLSTAFPQQIGEAPGRVAAYIEDGLSTILKLSVEPGLSLEQIEACRAQAQRDSRLQFIYRLPQSAGFGAAIGATLECALYQKGLESTRVVCALLNVFMTVLDGLMDEAPEIITPHWDALLALVCSDRTGDALAGIETPQDHPFNALCFSIAKLWIRMLHGSTPAFRNAALRHEFFFAARQAMLAEDQARRATFAAGPPSSTEELYGRTRWPHWCQALGCIVPHGWPDHLNRDRFRELIFLLGDYAAFLDDICDYVSDCQAERWNTISDSIYRRRSLNLTTPDAMQARLLVALADPDIEQSLLELGVHLRQQIERSVNDLGFADESLNPLIAALTHAYLG